MTYRCVLHYVHLYDLRDSSKLCGLQIGTCIVEVKTQMTDLFGVSNQFYTFIHIVHVIKLSLGTFVLLCVM